VIGDWGDRDDETVLDSEAADEDADGFDSFLCYLIEYLGDFVLLSLKSVTHHPLPFN